MSTPSTITRFVGNYHYLSNFYETPITLNGVTWPTAEHAYQAAKCTEPCDIELIKRLPTPGAAKQAGKRVKMRHDWNDVRVPIMESIVRAKFNQNKDIADKLVATGDAVLIEGNGWGDKFWGMCTRNAPPRTPDGWIQAKLHGDNHLGVILMDIRKELQSPDTGHELLSPLQLDLDTIKQARAIGKVYDCGSRHMNALLAVSTSQELADSIIPISETTDYDFYTLDTEEMRSFLTSRGFSSGSETDEQGNPVARLYEFDSEASGVLLTSNGVQMVLRSRPWFYREVFDNIDPIFYSKYIWKSAPNDPPTRTQITDIMEQLFRTASVNPVAAI